MKEYNIKLYSLDGTFLKTITGTNVISNVSFSMTKNAGQGQLSLSLVLPFNTTEFDGAKIISVICVDDNNIDGRVIYTGTITQINRIYENSKENIQIIALGLWILLANIYYKDSGNISFTKNTDPANIIKAVVDYFNTKYSGNLISYTVDSIQDYGTSVYKEFNTLKCDKAIQNTIDGLSYYLYLGADGIVKFQPKPTTITHKFTYELDVEKINIKESIEKIANSVIVSYDGGTTTEIQDTGSITENGLREYRESKTDIKNESSANAYRDDYLDDHKTTTKVSSIVVNSLYDIESILPGDTIEVRNFDYEISGLQVVKVNYEYDKVTLDLEDFTTIGLEIFS